MKQLLLFGVGFLCLVAAASLGFHLALVMAENYGQAQVFAGKSSQSSDEEHVQKTNQQLDELKTIEWTKKPKQGSKVAQLRIPSIDISVPVYMGVSDNELSKGVGLHETALPGTANRVALAGHRETAFQKADKLQNGDIFILDTAKGTFTYRIKKSRITDEDDRSVVVETQRPEAILYTCWPLKLGASTEKRLVFYADMVKSRP